MFPTSLSGTINTKAMTKSKYPPVLFNTEMVQAILDNRKKQTRRLLQPQPYKTEDFIVDGLEEKIKVAEILRHPKRIKYDGIFRLQAPKLWPAKYHIGNILWVRETWHRIFDAETDEFLEYGYKADHSTGIWSPSIHMPKAAARIFLKVTNVRAERLQDISEADAIAEGVIQHSDYGTTGYVDYENRDVAVTDIDAIWSYQTLWQSIYGKESWEQNPFVWVYDFEQVEKPADFLS